MNVIDLTWVRGSRARVWREHWPAIVTLGLFVLLSLIRAGPVGLVTGRRWHGWTGQGFYYASTVAFAHGDLAAAHHWYPLVYSLVSVPGLAILPYNPYLPIDALCVLVVLACVLRVAALFGIGRGAALILFLATTFLNPLLFNAWLEPWTSTLSSAFIWLLIAWIGTIVVEARTLRPHGAELLGALGMLVPLTRPADAAVVLVLGSGLAACLAMRRRLSWRIVGGALAGAAIPLAIYAALYLAIYGMRPTDYVTGSVDIGLSFPDIGWKATVLFVDSTPWFPENAGMLRWMPWLALGLAGGIVAMLRGPRPLRLYVAVLLAAMFVYGLILTAYVDLVPSGLWKFGNIHYFKWMFPLLGLLAWTFVRGLATSPKTHLAVLAAIVAVTGVRFDIVPAAPQEAARRVDFKAPPAAPPPVDAWDNIYFARSVVTDSGRVRRTYLGYRQVLDGDIVRVIALRRDFVGPVLWYGAGKRGVADALGDPKRVLAGDWPATPIKRWKARLGWGAPCWIVSCPDRR